MSTITREWLQQTINDYESVRDELPFGLDDYQGISWLPCVSHWHRWKQSRWRGR